jgi:hypothetical protein
MNIYIIFIATLLFLTSSKLPVENECIADLFKKTDIALLNKYDKNVNRDEDGIYHSIDSMNYTIIRRWTKRKKPIIESIENDLTHIEFWRGYNEKGILEEEGYMTSSSETQIGIWKYYSKRTKKLDSLVDYDKQYKVSFCEFYTICQKQEMLNETSTIRFIPTHRMWEVDKTINPNDNPHTVLILRLQVDSMKILTSKTTGHY